MSKKMKIILAVFLAVLLTVGSVSVVMAQTPTPTPTPTPTKGLLTRVAEILEIPEQTVVDAFKQAQKERQEEVFNNNLKKAVEDGRITQEQANEIKDWWAKRPSVIDSALARAFGRFGVRGWWYGPRSWCPPAPRIDGTGTLTRVAQILNITEQELTDAFKQAQQEMRQDVFNKALDRAVGQGRITQEQANQIREWVEQKPEGFNPGGLWRHMWDGMRGWRMQHHSR
jgi:uncharacterized protein YehS (DUF1456 family)